MGHRFVWMAPLLLAACVVTPPLIIGETSEEAPLSPQERELNRLWDKDDPAFVTKMIRMKLHRVKSLQDETRLHTAADFGKVNIVREWVHRGMDVNAQMMNGYTALHMAAYRDDVPMVKALLECKADPNIRGGGNRWGRERRLSEPPYTWQRRGLPRPVLAF